MRPQLPFLLFFLSLALSATAICVPRNTFHHPSPVAAHEIKAPPHEHLKHRHVSTGEHDDEDHEVINQSPQDSRSGSPPEAFHDVHQAVVQLCSRVDYPDACVSSLEPLLPGVDAVDPAVLLGLETKALRAKVKEAQTRIDELSKKPGTNPRQASNLQLCGESYDDASDDLESADQAVTSRDKGTAESMLSAVITDFETCEDGFAEDGLESPMQDMCREIEKLASNCLAFSSFMTWP